MSHKLTIFVRNDLKMRKGKMAAQSAHAAMKLFFESMQKTADKMIMHPTQNQEMLMFLDNPTIEIRMVKDEAELNEILDKSLPYSIIVDNGRTEFHGVPTTTCAAQGIFEKCDMTEMNVPQTYGTEIKAKQIFVFSKDKPLSKEMACQQAVLSCLKVLYKQMRDFDGKDGAKYFDLNEKSALIDWIMSAFAKIALSTKTLEEFMEVEDNIKKSGFEYEHLVIDENHCLCISPQYPAEIDTITGSLSLI